MNATPTLKFSANATPRSCGARSLHVVIVDEAPPFPASTTKQLRTVNLALRLAKRHHITLICPPCVDRNQSLQAQAFFLDHGIRTEFVTGAAAPQSRLGRFTRRTANLLSAQPAASPMLNGKAFRAALRAFANQNPVDLWQCETALCAEAVRKLTGARWLAMAHHIESRLQKTRFDEAASILARWQNARLLRRFLKLERRVFTNALTTVAFNSEDAALAQFAFGAPNIDVIDGGFASLWPDWDSIAAKLEQVWQRMVPVQIGQSVEFRKMAQSA